MDVRTTDVNQTNENTTESSVSLLCKVDLILVSTVYVYKVIKNLNMSHGVIIN